MTWYDFFSGNGFIFELLITALMFTWHLKKQQHFRRYIIGGIAVLISVSLLWNRFIVGNLWAETLRYILFFFLSMGIIMLCFRAAKYHIFFLMTAAGLVQHITFKLAALLLFLLSMLAGGVLTNGVLTAGTIDGANGILYLILITVIYLSFYFLFIRKFIHNFDVGFSGVTVLGVLLGMLLCVNLFQNLFNQYSAAIGKELYLIYVLFDICACFFLLLLQSELVNRERVQKSNAVLNHILHQQKEQLAATEENIQLINIKCHDLKKQIVLLGDKIEPEELASLKKAISIYDMSVRTGSDALDVLLTQKLLLCEQKGIQLDYMIDGGALSFMSASDIYSLFGNVIDNALEAIDKVTNEDWRYISLKVRREKGHVILHSENHYEGELHFDSELPSTTKENKMYHGFGMKSMKLIAEKYNGYLSIGTEGQLFVLNILLPLKHAAAL